MSKLKNAPLVEVVFELKWNISNNSINDFQYLIGDLYSQLKTDFKFRESLIPPGLPLEILKNQPCYRYRKEQNGYPLYQLGPGVLSYNTIDSIYYWDDFYNEISKVFNSFFSVYIPSDEERFVAGLSYFDFYPFDFKTKNVNEFLNNNFNISFSESFLKGNIIKPNDVNLSFNYEIEIGNLVVGFKRGLNSNMVDGIIVENRINSKEFVLEKEKILNWIEKSHTFTSQLFKDLVKKELFETFN